MSYDLQWYYYNFILLVVNILSPRESLEKEMTQIDNKNHYHRKSYEIDLFLTSL